MVARWGLGAPLDGVDDAWVDEVEVGEQLSISVLLRSIIGFRLSSKNGAAARISGRPLVRCGWFQSI